MNGSAGQEWEARAGAWIDRAAELELGLQPLADAMLLAAELTPGHRVIELACGPGPMLPAIARAVEPGGEVVATDVSPTMVAAAAALADENGLTNVELREMGVDWLDAPGAVADRILCRFGYMFATDPAAAFHEARRVLKPGGRLVAAVWAPPESSPYGGLPLQALANVGVWEAPAAGDAGMFRLADRGGLTDAVLEAGFVEAAVSDVELEFRFDSVEVMLDWFAEVMQRVEAALREGGFELQDRFDAEVKRLAAAFVDSDGSVRLPGLAVLLTAEA